MKSSEAAAFNTGPLTIQRQMTNSCFSSSHHILTRCIFFYCTHPVYLAHTLIASSLSSQQTVLHIVITEPTQNTLKWPDWTIYLLIYYMFYMFFFYIWWSANMKWDKIKNRAHLCRASIAFRESEVISVTKCPNILKPKDSKVVCNNLSFIEMVYLSGQFPDTGLLLTQFYISVSQYYWW